jgi:hypothetical protein
MHYATFTTVALRAEGAETIAFQQMKHSLFLLDACGGSQHPDRPAHRCQDETSRRVSLALADIRPQGNAR